LNEVQSIPGTVNEHLILAFAEVSADQANTGMPTTCQENMAHLEEQQFGQFNRRPEKQAKVIGPSLAQEDQMQA
jgi:hypothetical protein